MNSAEFIRMQVGELTNQDRITRSQLVEIIREILLPFDAHHGNGDPEPEHLAPVAAKLHRLIAVSSSAEYQYREEE